MASVKQSPAGVDVLTQWHRRFGGALRRYFARRGVDRAECDDLAQDIFLRLARQPGLADVRFAERYLMRVASNVLTDWLRHKHVRHANLHGPIEAAAEIADESASQEQVSLGRDALVNLRAALAKMPDRTQRIFELHHFEGLAYAAVATRCGIAVRTVEDHMARANLFLLSALEMQK